MHASLSSPGSSVANEDTFQSIYKEHLSKYVNTIGFSPSLTYMSSTSCYLYERQYYEYLNYWIDFMACVSTCQAYTYEYLITDQLNDLRLGY